MKRLWFIVFSLSALGCAQKEIDAPEELPALDEPFFRCQVQPVLASSCAFMDCHGNDERFFSIYAEQRFRLGVSWDDFETPLLEEELLANFRTASGFVRGDQGNLLAEKPLDTRAGGLYHKGEERYGRDDVFLSTDDPRYQVLKSFGEGQSDEAECVPREDLGL